MLIDWLTLRCPLDTSFSHHVREKLEQYIGVLSNTDSDGVLKWKKPNLDIDALRSDSVGLFWSIQGDGLQYYLTIGASPASLEHGFNVFGSLDIQHCSKILIDTCSKALSCIMPSMDKWQCRRIDITTNHALKDLTQVKQALRELRQGDGVRQKSTCPRGDTVVWGQGSDLISGKAYAKGPQLLHLWKRNKDRADLQPEHFDLADRLIRFELSLKSRWFRRHGENWQSFTQEYLFNLHQDYFNKYIGKTEVTDMGTLLTELEKVAPSTGRALAAHRTWALIKAIGYETARDSMPRSTFMLHQKYLRLAGLSQSDLLKANVSIFRRRHIDFSQPVTSWDDIRKAA